MTLGPPVSAINEAFGNKLLVIMPLTR